MQICKYLQIPLAKNTLVTVSGSCIPSAGVQVTLCTLTLGANPEYAGQRFYAEQLSEDSLRVQGLFEDAPQLGIGLQKRSLTSAELQVRFLGG